MLLSVTVIRIANDDDDDDEMVGMRDVYRVDNELLRACHPSGVGADRHCSDSDAKNDIGALCRHLLVAHGIRRQLKAALFVSNQSINQFIMFVYHTTMIHKYRPSMVCQYTIFMHCAKSLLGRRFCGNLKLPELDKIRTIKELLCVKY